VTSSLDAHPEIKVATFDHITSSTAMILPVKELTTICKSRAIMTVIDGAHAIGHVPIDIAGIGCDFYCSNLHKWMFAPKGSAFLYCAKEYQSIIQPNVTSHEWLNPDMKRRFWMQGTRDTTAFIASGAAIAFCEALNRDRIDSYRNNLMNQVIDFLGHRWSTSPICPRDMIGFMVLLKLPVAENEDEVKKAEAERKNGPSCPHTTPKSECIMTALLSQHKIIVPITSYDGSIYFRVSVQIYNEFGDYVKFAEVVEREFCK